jgi:catechol 2,3-dioxygenase-like lactoylglutathione lyase family enzyme
MTLRPFSVAFAVLLSIASFLACACVLTAQTTPASAPNANIVQAPAQTLLGQGWGVDHVGVAVRDLAQAQHDYEKLGFKVGKGGHIPGGVSNAIVSFQKNSHLELLSVSGSTPIKPGMASMIAAFLKKHEGAVFLGVEVSSAKATADYLKARTFEVDGPQPGSYMKEGETTLLPPMWYSVSPADEPVAGTKGMILPIFFIEYVPSERREKRRAAGEMDQPNTAIGIHAVWFAVHDLEGQLSTLHDAGLESGEASEAKFLGAHGRDVKAGQGVLLLLEASDKNGVLAKYLSDHTNWIDGWPHDEGIIGVSIEVADLGKARQLAESGTGRKLETYKGSYGASFLLPAEVTHGVWMEMFQVEH